MISNIQFAKDLYATFARGDITAVLAMFDPEIHWKPAEGHPYLHGDTVWIGPQAVLENLFKRIGSEWDNFAINVGELHDAGDHVVMEGRYTGTYKATGKHVDSQVCHVLRFAKGKLSSFHQYMDTAQFHAVMVS